MKIYISLAITIWLGIMNITEERHHEYSLSIVKFLVSVKSESGGTAQEMKR